MDMVYIYGLVDPRDRKIHYIGHTISTSSRLVEHIRDRSDTPKTQWIATLADGCLHPELVVLDHVDYANRFIEEYRWIYLGRQRAWPLTNTISMRTTNYTQLADMAESHVFVEIDKPLTWGMIGNVIVNFFTGDWLEERYLYYRLAFINLALLLMAIGTMMIVPGSVATELSGGVFSGYTWAIVTTRIGMCIFFVGAILMMPFVLPLYIGYWVELAKYLWAIPRRYREKMNGAHKVAA